jgi:hypothetical protein
MSLMTAQKPETFLLSQEQQDNLPPASREALEQVDQCTSVSFYAYRSKILSCNCTIQLATRPDNTALPTAFRGIRFLRTLVYLIPDITDLGTISFILQELILFVR